ncbi:hypothetical protein [Fodinibius salsisoli]|uniref:Peptidase MA superfamily protein n=1 Tax=Fodinibius salsisoli TaxID=2820877 RepID=A0ABT3PRC8_9BACT|nr:hypothetical protein [Fodinibius salsisoli]MCW9708415.1 hypothetical protein [Fodinibius salsisoli]
MLQNASFHTYQIPLLALLVGTGMLFIPLLGNFHIESAMLASLIGCFWAGLKACNGDQSRHDFFEALTILGYLYVAAVPLLVYALLSGCLSIHGLAFWILFPSGSVYFGYALGRLIRKWNIPYTKTLTVGFLLTIAIGILLFELFAYPQVYFFNHVWGGWPGPIYDETITVNIGTVFFRSITLFWILLLWHIPAINKQRFAVWLVAFSSIALGISYTQLAEMGVVSPPSYLQSVLGGHKETAHFNIYYDHQYYSEAEIQLLAQEHEFYFRQISNKLELSLPKADQKIKSYLYANPWQKKKLVGAKFTSYVPVWLGQDQLHIAKQQIGSSLKHELVHVLSKQFGNRLLNASWSIGLIEGVAVAVAGGSSSTTTIDQIVASERPYPNARELRSSFSPLGFYGGRSGVNYTTGGSFVQYLINNYPVEYLKEAYRTGRIGQAYPQEWPQLVQGWHRHLDSISVDSVDQRIARRIFAIPSLFEQPCPHVVSDFAAAWDSYQYYQATDDTAKALQALDKVLMVSDSLPPIKAEWSYRHLVAGHGSKVRARASLADTTVDLQLLYADAFKENGQALQAENHMERAQVLFNEHPDLLIKPALDTRLDSEQWQIYRQLTYQQQLPDSATFEKAMYRTKIRSIKKAIDEEEWQTVIRYGRQLLEEPIQVTYFDELLQLVQYLGFREKYELAEQWINKLSRLSLRDRYQQRLQQERKWLNFLESTGKN